MQTQTWAATALMALAAPFFAQSQVWIVDPAGGPGADFTSVTAAFAGAGDGDILVFRSGHYFEPFTSLLDGKGLCLVADGEVSLPGIEVKNLAAGQSFTARGFHGKGTAVTAGNCSGALWIEELTHGDGAWCDLSLAGCSAVALNRCDLRGFPSIGGPNGPGVDAYQSALHVYDCALQGGAGFTHAGSNVPGNVGLRLSDSFGFASGTAFKGGGFGAADADQWGPQAESILLDTSGAFDVQGGVQTLWPGTKRSFEATALAREGESATMTWTGAPGELAILNLSTTPGGLFFAPFNGSGVIGLPLLLIDAIAPLPAAGALALDVPIPELGAGVEGVVFYAQGSFADLTAGTIRLGGGSAIVLLDQAL